MPRPPLARSTPVALLMAALLLVLLAVSIASLLRFDSQRRAARHASDARRAIGVVLDDLVDAETSQRGFLLTGKMAYLAPFERVRAELPAALTAIAQLAADTPEQRVRSAELRRVVTAKMVELRHTVELRRNGHDSAALDIVASDVGEQLMRDVRRVAGAMTGDEEQRLEARRDGVTRGLWVALGIDGAAGLAVFALGGALFGIDRDVRRRSELERDLRAAAAVETRLRESFATTLRSIGDAVIATDTGGIVTFMNRVAEQLTGWTSDAAAGRPLDEVFVIRSEATRAPVESPVAQVLREGRIVGLANHTILVAKDGRELAIHDSAAPIRETPEGALVGVVLVFRDVEDERRTERLHAFLARASVELSASLDYEAALTSLARQAVPDFADWATVTLLDGPRSRRLAIATVDSGKEALVDELERRYPAEADAAFGVPRMVQTGQPEMVSEVTRAGIERHVRDPEQRALVEQLGLRSYLGVPLVSRGRIIGALSFAMSSSGRHYGPADLEVGRTLADRAASAIDNAQLYREAERARGDAELANRSKDEFLAILGHELRNPLAPIVTALQVMRLHPDGDHARERTIIERQVRHVVRLVDDLLDVSRIARGTVELTREPVDIADVINRALETAAPLVEERQHELTLDVERGLIVDGDAVRLTQVLANLVNNAAKYTEPRGHLSVRARREGERIAVYVRDDGMGIAPEMLPRVFDLFVQERQALDRARGGMGLGLAIVRSLVTLHGGRVSAHSDGLGRGSELRVELPAAQPGAVVEPLPRMASGALAAAGSAPATRLLVVDDNVDAAELLSDALELLGYDVRRAHDGPEALRVAAEQKPEVALLDIGLPVMDGYELAQRLRQLDGLQRIKLVAVTGYGQPGDRERSREAGFDAHLVKPIQVELIQRMLEQLAPPR